MAFILKSLLYICKSFIFIKNIFFVLLLDKLSNILLVLKLISKYIQKRKIREFFIDKTASCGLLQLINLGFTDSCQLPLILKYSLESAKLSLNMRALNYPVKRNQTRPLY